MGQTIRLAAADGHEFGAYRADPEEKPRGGIVAVQEIFGVNAHIRAVADEFASEGYAVIAPALFDRVERGFETGYDEASRPRARAIRAAIPVEQTMLDIDAAIKALPGKVGVVGYCWGGSMAWVSACRLEPACAVCYYGAQIIDFVAEKPRAPVIMHFGTRDPLIPAENIAAIAKAHPQVPIYTYDANHGFNCDARADYDADAAMLALERTFEHIRKYVG